MKTNLKLLIVGLLLMTLSSSAQDFPRQQVINGDTVILFTPIQLKYVNRTILLADYLQLANDNLRTDKVNLLNQIDLQIAKAGSLSQQIEIYKGSFINYSNIIEEKDKQIEFNKKVYKRKKRKAIFVASGIGLVAGLILSIFI